MFYNKLVFRVHAIKRMFQRHITEEEVRHALKSGKVIEAYPEDQPYPSELILGYAHTRVLHVVVAHNSKSKESIVITAYEPDPQRWESDFKRRKP